MPRQPDPPCPLSEEEQRTRDYWHALGMPAPLTLSNETSPARLLRPGTWAALAMVYLTDPGTRKRDPYYARNAVLFAHANQLEYLVREALEHMTPELAEIAQQVLGMLGPAPADLYPKATNPPTNPNNPNNPTPKENTKP